MKSYVLEPVNMRPNIYVGHEPVSITKQPNVQKYSGE
jgi:hypothetical protein